MNQLKIKDYAEQWGVRPNDVCYWDIVAKELKGSQKTKAVKFNRENLIQPKGHGQFRVLPIKGYNSNTYEVENIGQAWTCDCQFYQKTKEDCSHILAVLLYMRKQLHMEGD